MHKLYDAQRRRVNEDNYETPPVDSSNSADADPNADADTDALQPQTTTLHDYWTLAVPPPPPPPRGAPS